MHSLTTDCNQNNYDYSIALIIVSLTSLTECISKIMHIYILLCYLWNYIYAKQPKITLHINHLLCMSIGSLSTKLSKFYFFFQKIHLFILLNFFGQYVSTVLRYCLKSMAYKYTLSFSLLTTKTNMPRNAFDLHQLWSLVCTKIHSTCEICIL